MYMLVNFCRTQYNHLYMYWIRRHGLPVRPKHRPLQWF
jgi:hypothetical protein